MEHTTFHFNGKHVAVVLVSLLHLDLFWREPWTEALDIIHMDSPELTCTEGLLECKVTSVSLHEALLSDPEGTVNVSHMDLKVVLCCSDSELCEPCLQVILSLTEEADLKESGDGTEELLTTSGSGPFMFPETLVTICFSSPGSGDFCKTVQFTFSTSDQTSKHELLLRERVMFGSLILVRVLAQSKEHKQQITIPSLENVCLLHIEGHQIKDCDASRWRWIVILLVALLLVSVSILGACCIQGLLKGYTWRWTKDADVRGAVGGGHVVLLYPPDDEQALPGLMCHLGSSLQALGCSVSLDLWSHAELSVLGPVPWLHSRLDQLQRQGGKVVLVLTQAARSKAEEWAARSWERFTPNQNSTCVDVFSASLSCILADYLQGRAGERFMLVQFESLPPEGVCQPLPELFRGLHVYSLPSQSLGFLTELAGARQMATSALRRKRAHGLRMASRALARGLSGFTAGTAVLRLAAMPQSCVGTGEEDLAETIPLQPYLLTPPSSPDSHPKMSWMESV